MTKDTKLLFRIQPSSGIPIYRQILDQVQRLVASGHLRPGDQLPSVRHAASELAINQMTISKAYSLLEATGVLERKRGRPMTVAETMQTTGTQDTEHRLALIRPTLKEAANQAKQLDLSQETVLAELKKYMEEMK